MFDVSSIIAVLLVVVDAVDGYEMVEWLEGNIDTYIYIYICRRRSSGGREKRSKSNEGVLVLYFFLVKNSGFCLDLRGKWWR